jgi:hypothetical protein
MLFKEIIAVYTENHTKHIIQNAELLIIKAGGGFERLISYKYASRTSQKTSAGESLKFLKLRTISIQLSDSAICCNIFLHKPWESYIFT